MASDRWAERDRRRAEHERWMEQQRQANRDHHVDIVAAVLMGRYGAPRHVAEAAVDALIDAGVVFAYMNHGPDRAVSTGEDPTTAP